MNFDTENGEEYFTGSDSIFLISVVFLIEESSLGIFGKVPRFGIGIMLDIGHVSIDLSRDDLESCGVATSDEAIVEPVSSTLLSLSVNELPLAGLLFLSRSLDSSSLKKIKIELMQS